LVVNKVVYYIYMVYSQRYKFLKYNHDFGHFISGRPGRKMPAFVSVERLEKQVLQGAVGRMKSVHTMNTASGWGG